MGVVEPRRSIIGRYELHAALAAGGMATVHLGRMRSETGLARTVALKRMHPHFASDPTFVEMFFDEARLAMRLQHPNIVATFDVVRVDEELLLVMEYIHGESLAGLERVLHRAGERIPAAIASSIALGVLAGLHAAHEARSEDGAPLRDRPPRRQPAERHGGRRRRRAAPRLRHREGCGSPALDGAGAAQGQVRVHGARAAHGRRGRPTRRRVRRSGRPVGSADRHAPIPG